MENHKPLEVIPCPKCGALPDQWDVNRETRTMGVITEVTCRKCGFSKAEMVVERRKNPSRPRAQK
jgi:C4-type Zn-finger protein